MAKQTKLSEAQIKFLKNDNIKNGDYVMTGERKMARALVRMGLLDGDMLASNHFGLTPEGEKVRAELLAAAQTEAQDSTPAFNNLYVYSDTSQPKDMGNQPSAAMLRDFPQETAQPSAAMLKDFPQETKFKVGDNVRVTYLETGIDTGVITQIGTRRAFGQQYLVTYDDNGEQVAENERDLEHITPAQPPAEGVLTGMEISQQTASMKAEIARLQAQNAALREALQKLYALYPHNGNGSYYDGMSEALEPVWSIAGKALKGE